MLLAVFIAPIADHSCHSLFPLAAQHPDKVWGPSRTQGREEGKGNGLARVGQGQGRVREASVWVLTMDVTRSVSSSLIASQPFLLLRLLKGLG